MLSFILTFSPDECRSKSFEKVKRSLLQINNKSFDCFCRRNKQKKDGKFFYKLKKLKQKAKIIFMKFAPKSSALKWQCQRGPQQIGWRHKVVYSLVITVA